MKHLLTLLIERGTHHPPWWQIRSSTGDPPDERSAMHTLGALLTVILTKLKRTEHDHEQATQDDL